MFEFLKLILSELKDLLKKDDNSKESKYKKIIYILILVCAIVFLGIMIFYIIKAFPAFTQSVQENYNDSKGFLDENVKLK